MEKSKFFLANTRYARGVYLTVQKKDYLGHE